jgi:hypothetical protein
MRGGSRPPDPPPHSQAGRTGVAIQRGEIREDQVAPVSRKARNPLVVVQEIPASIKDEVSLVDLHPHGMMGGMAVEEMDARLLDEAAGEAPM